MTERQCADWICERYPEYRHHGSDADIIRWYEYDHEKEATNE